MNRPMTGQEIAAAVERARAKLGRIRLHTSDCPVWYERACRCGVSPIEGVLEDAASRREPPQADDGPAFCEFGDL